MSGLEDSHIFTAEMQKKIRPPAYEEARPVFICRSARERETLCFDGLFCHVNDVLISAASFAFSLGHLGG